MTIRSDSVLRTAGLTLLAMLAFAGNSLLCRAALQQGAIDAASFTAIRLVAGAVVLWLLVRCRTGKTQGPGSWTSALALFGYAAAFSFAYISLDTGVGALLLFGAVQATMIGYGLFQGERFSGAQWLGLVLALSGLAGLMLPGASAPPWSGALLMLLAGVAWGVYSLRGRGAGDPTRVTAGNFLRAAPMALGLALLFLSQQALSSAGVLYAIASGALASGMGYAVWYAVLPRLRASSAATIQLSVPVLASLGGVMLLGEALTLRLLLASVAILGGIALVILQKKPAVG